MLLIIILAQKIEMSEEQFIQNIKNNIKALRESKKISQVKMGEALRLGTNEASAQSAYSRLENSVGFSVSQLYKVAKVLGVEPIHLIKGGSLYENIENLIQELQNFKLEG